MVKGLSKKIIIVKSPDPKIFEQAIFIVRDDYMLSRGIDDKELLRQAKEAASGYVEQNYGRRMKWLRLIPLLLTSIAIGAALFVMLH